MNLNSSQPLNRESEAYRMAVPPDLQEQILHHLRLHEPKLFRSLLREGQEALESTVQNRRECYVRVAEQCLQLGMNPHQARENAVPVAFPPPSP